MKKLFIKLSLLLILSAICLVFANSIYKKYFYWADIDRFDANILLQLDSLQYVSDVLYFAESSNACYAQSDTNKSSTSNILDSLSPFKVNAVEHGALHAGIYLPLIKNIDSDAKVKTIIVALNLRSFNADWIHSELETKLSQSAVMYEPNLPIIKRLRLAFNDYDNQSIELRNYYREQQWRKDFINVPQSFKYKNVRAWDNGLANGSYLLPNGDWDMPKISLACSYVKSYAFTINPKNNPRIKDFDEIVTIAKQKKLKLIFNLLAENVEYADSLVGSELVNLMMENKNFLVERYSAMGVSVVDNFTNVAGKDYIDQDWTTEHYNQTGRFIIAQNLFKQIK